MQKRFCNKFVWRSSCKLICFPLLCILGGDRLYIVLLKKIKPKPKNPTQPTNNKNTHKKKHHRKMLFIFKSQNSLTPVDLLLVEDLSLAKCTKDNKHLSGVPCLSTAASSSLSILRLKSLSFSEDASFSL